MNLMKNYKYLIALLFVLTLVTGLASGLTTTARAQSEAGWTDPVNLSNSGSSKDPWMVVDSNGTIHVFWLDEIDGYKYANSVDGVAWSEPITVKIPFPEDPEEGFKPVFLADGNGTIHILWLDRDNVLQYRRSSSSSLGMPSTWTGALRLAESAIHFDAAVDTQGALHVGYINNIDSNTTPAGTYYRRLKGSSWSAPTVIYPSKYFRSLTSGENANIQLATSTVDEQVNVQMAWDDRSQRRIFLAKSLDGGEAWDGPFQVRGPEDFAGNEIPFNINLSVDGNQTLLLWQAGIPGGPCTQYSQWSVNGSEEFSQPAKISDELPFCPQSSDSIPMDKNLSVVSFQMPNELSLVAWDGSMWSDLQSQSDAYNFTNPATFANVLLGCQNIAYFNKNLYLVGCDEGSGGDIWFTSRAIGNVEDWFPPPTAWTSPSILTSLDQDISSLTTVADDNNNIHAFWVQTSLSEDSLNKTTIQYARWDGKSWSEPTAILTGFNQEPLNLTTSANGLGRIFLSWVDGQTGDLLFTWAGAERANRPSEWEEPQFIPSKSEANSSPDILTDDSGMMLVAYAVPINEQRGVYLIGSSDAGKTWSSTYQVFDADSAGWDMVDQPRICLTGDGRLHALFSRFSLLGDGRQSTGLFYSQSIDGGATWTIPEAVSEQPILWSEISCSGQQTIHRIWQEENKSYFIYMDQVSQDGGLTWDDPVYITSLSEKPTQGSLTSWADGQLYFIQMIEDENLSMQEWKWDGTLWNLLGSKELFRKGKTIPLPLSVAAGITNNGSLSVLISTQNQDPTSEPKNEIISLSRSLETPANLESTTRTLIPTPGAVETETVLSSSNPIPTETASFAEMSNPASRTINKNYLGLLLVGGLLAIFAIFILPRRKKGSKK